MRRLSSLPACSTNFQSAWRKILYESQPFADNHVDPTFLDSIRFSRKLKVSSDYVTLCRSTAAACQHLSVTVLIPYLHSQIRTKRISGRGAVTLNVAVLLAGHVLDVLLIPRRVGLTFSRIKNAAAMMTCLLILSPAMWTLTETYSADTVAAASLGCFAVSVIFFDYTCIYDRSPEPSYGGWASLNFGMIGCVILASRLASALEVFAFLSFSLGILAFSPMLRRSIWSYSPRVYECVVTPSLCLMAVGCVANVSASLAVYFLISLLFIIFCAPFILKVAQKWKSEIRGPWDIPEITQHSD